MKIVIRADASVTLGVGHVMRCLTLAQVLRHDGHEVTFICRAHTGHLGSHIQAQGFLCHMLEADPAQGILGASIQEDIGACVALARDAHLVIVDHYALDSVWEHAMPCPVMAIDDMFDRPHACRLLLNQNLGVLPENYKGLVPQNTLCLTGVEYALLRPEFAAHRKMSIAGRSNRPPREILVTLGGSDENNATGWVLDALDEMGLPKSLALTVVMGASAPHLDRVTRQARHLEVPVDVLRGSNDMAGLMSRADLAIGAAGSTSWERCALGLPTVMVVLAENQKPIAAALDAAGAARLCTLGNSAEMRAHIKYLLEDPLALARMQTRAAQTCDAAGSQRVVQSLYKCLDSPNISKGHA